MRRQNPLELVFEDVSTFDAENPITGSLLREPDVKKKILASDLIKGAPTPPGKDPEIQKLLDRLRDRQEPGPSNNLLPPPSPPSFSLPSGPFIPPPSPPFQPPPSIFNSFLPPPPRPDNNFGNFHVPAQLSSASFPTQGPSGNLFGSQTATLTMEKQEKIVQDSVQKELDDTIYELPDPPTLELGDGLLDVLGVEANDVLDKQFVNKKEEEDAVLEQIKEDYDFDHIKDAFDEGIVPPQVDFFYGGDNENFVRAVEFLSPSSDNRELVRFFLLDLGQNVMNNNSLFIHIESGDIFYQNYNMGENFYNF